MQGLRSRRSIFSTCDCVFALALDFLYVITPQAQSDSSNLVLKSPSVGDGQAVHVRSCCLERLNIKEEDTCK